MRCIRASREVESSIRAFYWIESGGGGPGIMNMELVMDRVVSHTKGLAGLNLLMSRRFYLRSQVF